MYPNRPASRSSNYSRKNSRSRSLSRNDNRERVCLSHGCYVCGSVLSTASAARNHIARIHGMYLPPRDVGSRRPQENDCVFVPHDENRDSDHYACPSCWFHCPYEELDILNDHTLDEHDPQPILNQDNDNEEEEEAMPIMKNGRRRSVSSYFPANRQQAKRPLSRSNSRQSGRQQSDRPASRQGNRPASRAEAENDDDPSQQITKKLDELVDLFKVLFSKKRG